MITIKKGLNLPIAGAPAQRLGGMVETQHYAVLGKDYIGLKPAMRVVEGDKVKKGQVLFEDKKNPGVVITAPVAGIVSNIHRGERRVLKSVEIERDDSIGSTSFKHYTNLSNITAEEIRKNLQLSGEWSALRTRPFNKIPAIDSEVDAIFVTTIDTNPLAIDPSIVVNSNIDAFYDGLLLLSKLTDGKVYICTSPKIQINTSRLDSCTKSNFSQQIFNGPHPAGLASTHIHHLYPVDLNRKAWVINYQDLIAFGNLFRHGKVYSQRDVALAGPQVVEPKIIKVERGACLHQLTENQLKQGQSRIISGSVLSGHHWSDKSEAFLGRYHVQVSVIEETEHRPLLHYLVAGRQRFSIKPIYLSKFNPKKLWNFTATTNGSPRAMVPIGTYEEIMPLDILPTQLLRALLVGDSEKAQLLGCLELVEEDLALCTYVCPGKYDYGPILRNNLTAIEMENLQ